jgi:RNA polymerase sigma factor (sigma-70 family)
VEDWVAELQKGRSDAAWDLFLDRYRRLIFAAIRHYAQDYDDVMDVFARACESLRADDLRRLRSWVEQPEHRARFSTWLVTVVRHLTVDWFRRRDGRRRLSAVAEGLPPLRRRIFEHVFLDHHSHIEAYELIHAADAPALTFREFLSELRATYQALSRGRRGQVLRDLTPASHAVEDLPADPTGPTATSAAEQSELVERALNVLDPDDRLIVELYVLEELPAETVAKVLGLANAKTVYNRAYRALALVREQLERAGVRREDL